MRISIRHPRRSGWLRVAPASHASPPERLALRGSRRKPRITQTVAMPFRAVDIVVTTDLQGIRPARW
jgi:hypothetical protein